MDITDTVQEAHELAKSKGFWDEERNTGELLALIHSEVSEALEADRSGSHCGPDAAELAMTHADGGFKVEFLANVKDSFEDELADIVIRVFDLAGGKGIDLSTHIEAKLRYNAMRPVRHGKKY